MVRVLVEKIFVGARGYSKQYKDRLLARRVSLMIWFVQNCGPLQDLPRHAAHVDRVLCDYINANRIQGGELWAAKHALLHAQAEKRTLRHKLPLAWDAIAVWQNSRPTYNRRAKPAWRALWEKQFATIVNEATLTCIRTLPAYAEKLARSRPSENSAKLERAAANAFLVLPAVTTILGNMEESAMPTMSAMVVGNYGIRRWLFQMHPLLLRILVVALQQGHTRKVSPRRTTRFGLIFVNHVTSLYLMIKQRVNSLHKYFFLMLAGVGILSIIVPVLYLILRPELRIKMLFIVFGLMVCGRAYLYRNAETNRRVVSTRASIRDNFRSYLRRSVVGWASSQFVHWLDGFSSAVGATGAIAVYWFRSSIAGCF
jgi:nitrate reductase NapE component